MQELAQRRLKELLTFEPMVRSDDWYIKTAEERAEEDSRIREYNQKGQAKIKIIKEIKEDYDKIISDPDRYLEYFSYECSDPQLKKWLLSETNIYPTYFVENFFNITDESMIGFLDIWIKANEERIEDLRNNYLWPRHNPEEVKELTRRELLKYNPDTTRSMMTKEQLQKAFLPFFAKHPKLFSWEYLHQIHEQSWADHAKRLEKERVRQEKIAYGLIKAPKPVVKFGPQPMADEVVVEEYVPGKNPWKSKGKITAFGRSAGWTTKQTLEEVTKMNTPDSFNMQEQRKLMKHFCGPRYSFVIDYMFAGKYPYVIAINMNTRKVFWTVAGSVRKSGGYYYVPRKPKDTTLNAIKALEELLEQTPIKHLLSDQEPAWTSREFQNFVASKGIKHRFYEKYSVADVIETQDKTTRGTHSYTSLIDRVIRTIRLMAYNLENKTEIEPTLMEYIVNVYNSTPHSTLTKFNRNVAVSPNEVDADPVIEQRIVEAITIENMKVKLQSPPLQIGSEVRVYNQANAMDKVKPKLLPGYWKVVGKNNGLVELQQGKNRIKVNRWMIKLE